MEYLINEVSRITPNLNESQKLAHRYNFEGAKCADEGRLREALMFFDKAIELCPDFIPALFNRGTVKADLGDFNSAKKDFEAARRMNESLTLSTIIDYPDLRPLNINFY